MLVKLKLNVKVPDLAFRFGNSTSSVYRYLTTGICFLYQQATLQDKPGISIIADRGFTIKDKLKELNIELNLPSFMEGRKQLPAEEVQEGRKIASLRIHVERAIGRIKTFFILKETIPISLACLTNQTVYVYAFLANFHPPLAPLEEVTLEGSMEDPLTHLVILNAVRSLIVKNTSIHCNLC